MGNTRVSFKDSSGHLVKTAETAFDPWGLKLTGVGSVNEFQNRWEMQGKEAEQAFGLNRVNFGARVYNPTIGRWDRVDNFSEAAPNLTGYRYSFNNPVNVIDPDGNFEYSDGYSMNSSNNGTVGRTSFNGIYSTGRAEPQGQQDCPDPPCGTFERLFANPQTKEEANDFANARNASDAIAKMWNDAAAKMEEYLAWIPFGDAAWRLAKADADTGLDEYAKAIASGTVDAAGGGMLKIIMKGGGRFLPKEELAKRLGTTVQEYHDVIKPIMKKDFAGAMKKIGATNPDFSPDDLGNVMLKHPKTGKTVWTNIPFEIYKK